MNTAAMTKMKVIRRSILHHADFDFMDYPIVGRKDPLNVIEIGILKVVNEIDDWHSRRWRSGLGYHFIIGNGHGIPDGYVAIGRPMKYQGAHVRGHNHDSIGILVVGDLMKHDPTDAQISAVINLCAFLCFAFGLKPTGGYSRLRFGKRQKGMVISGHKDWPPHQSNNCPGSLEKFIPRIRIEARSLLFSKMISLPYTPK